MDCAVRRAAWDYASTCSSWSSSYAQRYQSRSEAPTESAWTKAFRSSGSSSGSDASCSTTPRTTSASSCTIRFAILSVLCMAPRSCSTTLSALSDLPVRECTCGCHAAWGLLTTRTFRGCMPPRWPTGRIRPKGGAHQRPEQWTAACGEVRAILPAVAGCMIDEVGRAYEQSLDGGSVDWGASCRPWPRIYWDSSLPVPPKSHPSCLGSGRSAARCRYAPLRGCTTRRG
jgi:hypothetical protein